MALPNQLDDGKLFSGTDAQNSKIINVGAEESKILSGRIPSPFIAQQDESHNFNFEAGDSKEELDNAGKA